MLALADRIAVIYEGQVRRASNAAAADVDEIGLHMMAGDGAEPAGEARRPRLPAVRPCVDSSAGWRPALAAGRTDPRPPSSRPDLGAVILLVGGDPIESFHHIFDAAFGRLGVISDTLVKATPLILTGLACALAFRMRLWNIGAEGQFLLGAWGASAVVLVPLLPAGTPAFVVIPAMMVAGFAGGARVGLHPGRPEGALRGQRDHHHADAQLHRADLGPVLGLRAVERGRLPVTSSSRARHGCRG